MRSAALLLDHRLGHAQFVDPVVQRGDVLLDGLLLHFARGRLEGGDQLGSAPCVCVDLQVGKLSVMTRRAASSVAASRARISMACPRG
jgi:hypothetical protein